MAAKKPIKTEEITISQREIIFSIESFSEFSGLWIKAQQGSELVDADDLLIANVKPDFLWIHMVRLTTTYSIRGYAVFFKEVTRIYESAKQ